MQEELPEPVAAPVAVFKHLTGPSQGTTTWIGDQQLYVTLRQGRILQVSAQQPKDSDGDLVARLQRSNGSFEIEAVEGRRMWVNGHPTKNRKLKHHDTIEFSDLGPITRVYLYRNGQPGRVSVADIFSDAAAYLRSSRRSLGKRLGKATTQVLRRLMRETTPIFRIGVCIALLALGIIVYQQSRIDLLMHKEIESGAAQLEDFSRRLAQIREEALTPEDLGNLREDLVGRMATATERLSLLERRSTATARVIAASRPSILFLQGTYSFRERSTGRILRHAIGTHQERLALPKGLPLLTFDGDGPMAVRYFNGTGFVLGDVDMIVTSRHIGEPWSVGDHTLPIAGNAIEPVSLQFKAYSPDMPEAIGVSLIATSNVADLAVLRAEKPLPVVGGLRLAERLPEPGEEVILIGYPTGMRSMLAEAGPEFVEELQQQKVTDNWTIAERLAAAKRMVPLASRGIVGRVSRNFIIYDAQTTYGGSGGPVLDINGEVVAVNSAILPEYGGSNLGVPANELRELILKVQGQ